MEQAFQSVLLLSCAGGALAGALRLARPLTRRVFSPGWHYGIWLCALVIFVLPLRLDLPSRPGPAPAAGAPARLTEDAEPDGPAEPDKPADPAPTGRAAGEYIRPARPDVTGPLARCWLVGALALLAWHMAQYLRFLRAMRRGTRPVACPEAARVKAELGLRRRVRVRAGGCPAPLTMGVFRVTLLLPDPPIAGDALLYVLRHELTHVKRLDLACKWFALVVRCVHWFNPLAYLACRSLEETCEEACDSAVAQGMDAGARRGYMSAILALAGPRGPLPFASRLTSDKQKLERRFTVIQQAKRPSRLRSALAALTALALVSAAALAGGAAAGAAAGEEMEIGVWNGAEQLRLTHPPFVEDGEIYLPLRQTLSGFGITGLRWEDGTVTIALPGQAGGPNQVTSCQLVVGQAAVAYPEQGLRYPIRRAPLVKNGVTYVTTGFFEELMVRGQIPRFRVSLTQSSDPKDHCRPGEEVFIGTGPEQDAYHPVDQAGNPKLVKRIVTDERGRALYVIPVENQRPQALAALSGLNTGAMEGYSKVMSSICFFNAYGEYVQARTGILVYEKSGDQYVRIAYIPPAYQINPGPSAQPAAQLSRDAVCALAEKGEALSWEDFAKYDWEDVGSGLIIRAYPIDESYYLLIGGRSIKERPLYITLVNQATGEQIDIRRQSPRAFMELAG